MSRENVPLSSSAIYALIFYTNLKSVVHATNYFVRIAFSNGWLKAIKFVQYVRQQLALHLLIAS